jgi:YjbE family integral membrane protein
MLQWLSALGGIILIDLILSGDNALVIGAVASTLPRRERLWAIICGGSGAIVLRICFAVLATYLFQIPLLGMFGGILLLFIAIHLLVGRSRDLRKSEKKQKEQKELLAKNDASGFAKSIATILVADLTMSLDNVLAVGAIAGGQVIFIVLGLVLSIVLLLVGSALIAEVIDRLPWLLDIACLVIAYTAAHILMGDDLIQSLFEQLPFLQILTIVLALLIVLAADLYLRFRDKRFLQSHMNS